MRELRILSNPAAPQEVLQLLLGAHQLRHALGGEGRRKGGLGPIQSLLNPKTWSRAQETLPYEAGEGPLAFQESPLSEDPAPSWNPVGLGRGGEPELQHAAGVVRAKVVLLRRTHT